MKLIKRKLTAFPLYILAVCVTVVMVGKISEYNGGLTELAEGSNEGIFTDVGDYSTEDAVYSFAEKGSSGIKQSLYYPCPDEFKPCESCFGCMANTKEGDPVFAFASGVVGAVFEKENSFEITLIHSDSLTTVYSGDGRVTISEGDFISGGDKLADARDGSLHFKVLLSGEAADALFYLSLVRGDISGLS